MARLVLFDLDGTLLDSAPDLIGAAQRMRAARGLAPARTEDVRPTVSSGGRGILGAAFGLQADDPEYPAMLAEFLDIYSRHLAEGTRFFPGVPELLDALDARGILWAVVTNKRSVYTTPVTQAYGLAGRAAAIVSGDTAPKAKPHPDPAVYAMRACGGIPPQDTVFVGDDRRDIACGRNAGCRTIAVRYGYLGIGEDIGTWGADAIADTPERLRQLLLDTF